MFATFQITSLDSTLAFNTLATITENEVTFLDQEGDMNVIILNQDHIQYFKNGSVDMFYHFDLDQMTEGTYTISNNTFEFQIVTNEMYYDETMISISYDLYQENDLVNQTTLLITFEAKEEI